MNKLSTSCENQIGGQGPLEVQTPGEAEEDRGKAAAKEVGRGPRSSYHPEFIPRRSGLDSAARKAVSSVVQIGA